MEFHQALNDGQFPPRWASHFFGNIGSPVLMLNYHLPYFVADGFVRLGFSFFDAFKLTLGLSFVLSGVFMFFALKKMFSASAALTGSLLYMWAPYRFVDLYVRAAFGESFSFIFPPILLYSIMQSSFLLTALGFAGLFLSHPVASAFFAPFFLGLSVVYHGFVKKSWKHVLRTCFAFLLAFAFAAYNLVPTLTLTKFTHYNPSNSTPLNHFPSLRQSLTAMTWGYAGSTPNNENEFLSYHVGYPHSVVFIITFIFLCVALFKQHQKNIGIVVYTFFTVCIAFFVMQKISTPVWNTLHLQFILDFPWRILLFLAFATSVLSAWVVISTTQSLRTALVVFLVAFALRSNINHIHINKIWPWGIEHYIENYGTGDAYGEYASKVRFSQNSFDTQSRIDVLEGNTKIIYTKNLSHDIQATLNVQRSSRIRFNVMHFPGWKYWINNQRVEVGKTCILSPYTGPNPPTEYTADSSGLLECPLDPGTHVVRAYFTEPKEQKAGNLISLAGFGVFLWIAFQSFFPHTTKKQTLLRSRKK